MATDVVQPTDRIAIREPKPGVIDRLLGFVDRLPGPAAAAYLLIGLALAVVAHLIFWATDSFAVGTISANVLMPALAIAWFGWLLQTLNRVARETFDDFTPALSEPEAEDAYRLQLTSIRDRDAILAGIAQSQ